MVSFFGWFQWHSSNLGPFWGNFLFMDQAGSSKWPFWRFQVTFSGVNMVKWPPYGWSKGHLEEAGKNMFFGITSFSFLPFPSLVNDGSQWNCDSMVVFVYQHVNVIFVHPFPGWQFFSDHQNKTFNLPVNGFPPQTRSNYVKLLLVSTCKLVNSAAGEVFVSLETIFLWKLLYMFGAVNQCISNKT